MLALALVLVCGGRDYSDRKQIFLTLDRYKPRIGGILTGAATGADLLAEEWARKSEVDYIGCPAKWSIYERAAGPLRNQYMLDNYEVGAVIAFPGGVGTRDMISRAKAAGIVVIEVSPK